ncbi:MAG: glycosyltransferase family 39 protein, partial [Candidatus Shapirobacteria bacterium]
MSRHGKLIRILFITATSILLLYGLFLRTNGLLTQPYWMDEGYTINAVMSYAEGHMNGISAVLDSGQKYECFLYCFPTALIANQFGLNQFSFRIISVLFGLISILALYVVTRKLFDQKIALLTAFFMNFAYFQIAWSMQARWYTMFTAFFWFSIFFFIKSIESKNKNKIWPITLTIIFTVLAIMSQKIGIVLLIFFTGYILFLSLKEKIINWKLTTLISGLIILGAY